MKPAYTVNAKGVISIDYLLFREMDPYAVCAATRGNLRSQTQQRHPTPRQTREAEVRVLVNVGQR